jgi:hypothetical protein
MKIFVQTAVFCLLVTSASLGSARENVIGNPLKIGLDGLSNRAKDILDKATNNGLILETNAAQQALGVIGNAQQAFEKELKATSHTINKQEQQIISGITQILDEIQNHTLESVSSRITTIALMIPTVGNYPQLRTYTGNIIIPNTSNVTVKLQGVFKYAARSGYEPTIKLGDDIYLTSEKNETNISFDIPSSKFKFQKNNVSYLTALIVIPYDSHFFLPKQKAEYKIKIILLPESPGNFEFIINTFVDERQTKQRECDLSWSGHEDLIKYCYPDAGYIIDVSTINRKLSGEVGDGFGHDHFDLGSDFNKPEVNIGYHIKSDGDKSYVSYHITYTMFRYMPVPVDKSAGQEQIRWGDSKTYTITDDQATWKAIYTQFDGRKVAFASGSQNNPYIRIKQVTNQIIVSAAPFD